MTRSEKDHSGANLTSKVFACNNGMLNEQHRSRQAITQERERQTTFYQGKLGRTLQELGEQHTAQNSRLLQLQRRIWKEEELIGILPQAWDN